MGLMSQYRKYGVFDINVGIWDKENNTFTVSKEKVYKVVHKKSKPFKVQEAYGSGGWIEGYDTVTVQTPYFFCYDNENNVVGFIHNTNVMFKDPNRYQLLRINEINRKFNLED